MRTLILDRDAPEAQQDSCLTEHRQVDRRLAGSSGRNRTAAPRPARGTRRTSVRAGRALGSEALL
ncbi:hypothetical protein IL38_06820 [Actinopolyspora erythraea]|uniref:Uncharacterized protein n=1 Tax=Actinopolyspora erythraea TaxID=414996 RepID=A0ABR4X5Y3_9ACTN|nr:hypothetical protein [Actinopolyspora erythraea]KGI82042.1 hypothetical protein IL38_06820 [Actinopolyspora erythraea]